MSFSEVNIDVFRSINDLGKQYAALNPGVFLLQNIWCIF